MVKFVRIKTNKQIEHAPSPHYLQMNVQWEVRGKGQMDEEGHLCGDRW